MCIKHKASVQNSTEKTRGDVDPNFLSTTEDSRLPSAAIGPSGERSHVFSPNAGKCRP